MGYAISVRIGRALTAGVFAAVLLAACATPTPAPGEFETAVAGTVEAGGTGIAVAFVDQRATLTAGAPTSTLTPTPSDTPTETPTPTETATATDTPTPALSATPTATATHTGPPPPTNTPVPPTLPPVTAGTYPQFGTCTYVPGYTNGGREQLGRWLMCVTSLVIRPSGELLVNVSWTVDLINSGERQISTISLPAHDAASQAVYLTDSAGRRSDQIGLEGAARDGGNGKVGESVSGYYLFPAPATGERTFSLVISDKDRTISNLTLGVPNP